MAGQVTLAIIVARPGPLRDGLQNLMTTMSQIEILAETTDPSALMRLGANIQPHLVLLDASSSEDEAWSAVRRIKEEWSRTRCLVFVEDSQGQRKARAAGADVALLKGHRATKLIEAIEELLSRQG